MTPRFNDLLGVLDRAGVEFILVGGLAATLHGSSRTTYDVDIVYSRTPDNMRRLSEALAAHAPYLRGAPPGLPFVLDPATIERGLNFTLTTGLGDLDILGEIAGGGTYGSLLDSTILVELFGRPCRVLTLEGLIQSKRAAGRPKDFEAIAELQALAEARDDFPAA